MDVGGTARLRHLGLNPGITGMDYGNGRGRQTVARLRRELIRIPARITRRAGEIQLRLPPGPQLLATVLPALQRLPAAG